MIKYIFILILPLFLLSCNLTDKDDIDKAMIVNILRDIEYVFNGAETVMQKHEKIMFYYDENFLHDSVRYVSINNHWHLLINDFSSIKIEDISITLLDDDSALARFKITFFDRDHKPSPTLPEPYHQGYLSYFWYNSNNWKIYGNQNPNPDYSL